MTPHGPIEAFVLRVTSACAEFSIRRPKTVLALAILVSTVAVLPLPRIVTDTDPKHMLPETSPARQALDKVERSFTIHSDVIVLGLVRDQGVFTPRLLQTVARLTVEIQALPDVVSEDVTSLATLDNMTNVTGADGGSEVVARRFLDPLPETDADANSVREAALGNPLLVGRLVAADGTATVIHIPLNPGTNGKEAAERIRSLLPSADQLDGANFVVAGDPVTRDTFGAEMFRQMGLFSPMAGMIMCVVLFLLFRSGTMVALNMGVAMAAILWSMGGLIALGYPVHIMASMSPVFLMAIATDSVHIFNEFLFRLKEGRASADAVRETMAAVATPVFYSDITTAVGFASLATLEIVPVRIFGIVVAVGTLFILFLSFTLVPAVLMLIAPSSRSVKAAGDAESRTLRRLGEFIVRRPLALGVTSLILVAVTAVGLFQLRVNNNMVEWFRESNAVRQADANLNARLAGTALGYIVVEGPAGAIPTPEYAVAIEDIQRRIEKDPMVGRTFSVVDYLKRTNRVLHGDSAAFEIIPGSSEEIGQYLFLLASFLRPIDIANVVTPDQSAALIVIQLKTWDADAMRGVIRTLDGLSLPEGANWRPSGIAHFNMVWNDEVVRGMVESFLLGCVLVLGLLVIETRSLLLGLIAFTPLAVTIIVIYGIAGLVGKDFDMPVAVLSTLSLGLAVDFAIHFLERFRGRLVEDADWKSALVWTVARPGKGIFANAALFAAGFGVMFFADLTPYITVGAMMAAIMVLSSAASVILLPVLLLAARRILMKKGGLI